jgi:hypothetical protein
MTPLQQRHATHHMGVILAADVTKYVAATRARQRAEYEEKKQRLLMCASVTRNFDALRRHVKKMLAPHLVEWTTPSEQPAIDWSKEGTPHVWLHGEVFPRRKEKYTTHASLRIMFSAQPRDAEELHRVFAAVKNAADAMAVLT